MSREAWKPVPNYPDYEVSDRGRVRKATTARHLDAGEVLASWVKADGFAYVSLFKDGRPHVLPVHRIVALAFLKRDKARRIVRHLDGDRTNNAASNLRWVANTILAAAQKNPLTPEGDPPTFPPTVSPMQQPLTSAELGSLIEALGFESKKDFAEALGVSGPAVSKWLKGDRPVPTWIGNAVTGLAYKLGRTAVAKRTSKGSPTQ